MRVTASSVQTEHIYQTQLIQAIHTTRENMAWCRLHQDQDGEHGHEQEVRRHDPDDLPSEARRIA